MDFLDGMDGGLTDLGFDLAFQFGLVHLQASNCISEFLQSDRKPRLCLFFSLNDCHDESRMAAIVRVVVVHV